MKDDNKEYERGYYLGILLTTEQPAKIETMISIFKKESSDFLKGYLSGRQARLKEIRKGKASNYTERLKESMKHLGHYLREDKRTADYERGEPARKAQREAIQKALERSNIKKEVTDELLNPSRRRAIESDWMKQKVDEKVSEKMSSKEKQELKPDEKLLKQTKGEDSKIVENKEVKVEEKALNESPEKESEEIEKLDEVQSMEDTRMQELNDIRESHDQERTKEIDR